MTVPVRCVRMLHHFFSVYLVLHKGRNCLETNRLLSLEYGCVFFSSLIRCIMFVYKSTISCSAYLTLHLDYISLPTILFQFTSYIWLDETFKTCVLFVVFSFTLSSSLFLICSSSRRKLLKSKDMWLSSNIHLFFLFILLPFSSYSFSFLHFSTQTIKWKYI